MKGVPGFMIAVGLGVIGAFCNWFYLAEKARDLEQIEFVAIDSNVRVNAGDKFNASHFMPVKVPRQAVGNLEKVAYLWSVKETLEGMPATKSYNPNEIILRQDVRTLPPTSVQELLGEGEVEIGIPVDTRTFVPSLVNPGDLVSFIVPTGPMTPPPAANPGEATGAVGPPAGTEIIGPYRVISMGNRLASADVVRAVGMSASQENVMGVAVKFTNGQFADDKGRRLSEVLRMSNFQQAQVILHPTAKAPKAKK